MKIFIAFCIATCSLASFAAEEKIKAPADAPPAKVEKKVEKAAEPKVAKKVEKTAVPAPVAKTTPAPAKPVAKPAPAAAPAVAPAQEVKPAPAVEEESEDNPAVCFARGLSNVSLCWIEIPRCVVYDNYEVPFFGLLVGIPEGTILTVARIGSGLVDILSLGFSGNSLHSKKFPDYVWDAKWKPAKKK